VYVGQVALVLGAGAGLAQAEHFRPQRGRASIPPLDYTFFERIRDLKVHIPRQLRKYAEDYPGPDPFSPRIGDTPLRMEEFLKDLFYDFQQAKRGSGTATAYSQMVEICAGVLRDTTNWICTDTRTEGPIGRLIAEAAQRARKVSVITFNHDLVIENEIFKRARLRPRWCLELGYGNVVSRFKRFTKPASGSLFPDHSVDCEHSRGIQLFKLHGSLNWYVTYRGGRYPTPGQLLGTSRTPPTLYVTHRRVIAQQFKHRAGTQVSRTWPVLIPPIYGKEEMIRRLVSEAWTDARSALKGADRVVFFGYSLPALDIQAEKMVQRALADNTKAPRLDVIDPAPTAAARYASIAPRKPLRWFSSMESFLVAQGLD